MTDDDDCEDMTDFDAAYRVGAKVIEAADRIKPMHAIVPGSEAKWWFDIDDVRFEVTVKVAPPGSS